MSQWRPYPPAPPGWYRPWMVPMRPLRSRPRASASVILPLLGLLLVLLCDFLLPWFDDPAKGFFSAPDMWDSGQFLPYVDGGFVGLLIPSALVAFAGALDSTVFRVFFALGGVLTGLVVLVGGLIGGAGGGITMSGSNGYSYGSGTVVGVGVVAGILIAGLSIIYACIRGVGCRILSGLWLLAAAGIHAAWVRMDWPGMDAYPTAYLASLGYLICALGAFIGPRYETY